MSTYEEYSKAGLTYFIKENAKKEGKQVVLRSSRKKNGIKAESLAPPRFTTEEVADTTDNTLNGPFIRDKGVSFYIELWGNAPPVGYQDVVDPYVIHENGIRTHLPKQTLENSDFPEEDSGINELLLIIPVTDFPQGKLKLGYDISTFSGGEYVSEVASFIIDLTPPWGISLPYALETTLNEGQNDHYLITEADLTANPAGIPFTLPVRADKEERIAGDKVYCWFLDAPPGNDWEKLPPPFIAGIDIPDDGVLRVPVDLIKGAGDSETIYITYVEQDKAKNVSHVAYPLAIEIQLGALPTNLKDPRVPLAEVSGKDALTLDDAFKGITIKVDPYDGAKPGDKLSFTWGSSACGTTVLPNPVNFNFNVPVPNDVLRSEYGSAEGDKDVTVGYLVTRGGQTYPAPGEPVTKDFTTNFYVPGPDIPDWPDPVNPNLDVATLFGASYDDTGVENSLIDTDFGKDATVSVALYDPVEVGEIVYFTWNGKEVTEVEITDDIISAGKLEVTFPWVDISASPSNPSFIYYEIGNATSPNRQRSESTEVQVLAIKLPAPTYPKISDKNFLNCDSLNPDFSLPVILPDLSAYAVNNSLKVEIFWAPLDQLLAPDGSLQGNIVKGSEFSQEVTLTGLQLFQYQWNIPFEPYLLAVYENTKGHVGTAIVTYKLVDSGESSAPAACNAAFFGPNYVCNFDADKP